jgi:hypothetical protein
MTLSTIRTWLRNRFNRRPAPPQATGRHPPDSSTLQRPGMFDLPPGCTPIDAVLNTTRIPGTQLEIGTGDRVVESDRYGRIEFSQRRGVHPGCNHLIYSADEIAGQCPFCAMELLPLINEGQISQSQAEERSLFCIQCASYCMSCFRRICAVHTRIFPCPDGRVIPLCPACHEQVTHTSLIGKLVSWIAGK